MWPTAHSTFLVTDVGTGLEALALGLEVVPVATTAPVDELLALLAGGVEEEAAEKSLAVPTDRGQVAEICVIQRGQDEPGQGGTPRSELPGPQTALHGSGSS